MYDLGVAKRFLGIEIERTKEEGFRFCQQGYINTIIQQFRLLNAKLPKSPLDPQTDLGNICYEDKLANCKEYLSIVRSFIYVALGSRPDIAFSVNAVSRYNIQPLEMPTMVAKRVLQYQKTTTRLRIHYRRLPNPISIIIYTDSDWAGWRMCIWTRKHQCQQRTCHIWLDSLPIQVAEHRSTFNARSRIDCLFVCHLGKPLTQTYDEVDSRRNGRKDLRQTSTDWMQQPRRYQIDHVRS